MFKLFSKRNHTSKDQSPPRVDARRRIYAIGDIHGRLDLLLALLDKISEDRAIHNAARYELIFLGDYIDRGNQSCQLLDLLSQGPIEGFRTTYLCGNHEDYLLRFLGNPTDNASWLYYGGVNTLSSYGIPASPLEENSDQLVAIQQKLRNILPDGHLKFLNNLSVSHTVGDYFFVHAGVRPGIPLNEQLRHDLLWIREPFLNSTRYHGRVVVHGHSVQVHPKILPNRIGIDTGAYDSGVLTSLVLQGEGQWLIKT